MQLKNGGVAVPVLNPLKTNALHAWVNVGFGDIIKKKNVSEMQEKAEERAGNIYLTGFLLVFHGIRMLIHLKMVKLSHLTMMVKGICALGIKLT